MSIVDQVEQNDDAGAWRPLRELLREALPIKASALIATTFGGGPCVIPTVQVGTRHRPDVRDYVRVHRLEAPSPAGGETWSQVSLTEGLGPARAWIHVKTTRPAVCEFVLPFRLDRHSLLLTAIAESGLLWLTVEPFGVGADGVGNVAGVVIEVSGAALLGEAVRATARGVPLTRIGSEWTEGRPQ